MTTLDHLLSLEKTLPITRINSSDSIGGEILRELLRFLKNSQKNFILLLPIASNILLGKVIKANSSFMFSQKTILKLEKILQYLDETYGFVFRPRRGSKPGELVWTTFLEIDVAWVTEGFGSQDDIKALKNLKISINRSFFSNTQDLKSLLSYKSVLERQHSYEDEILSFLQSSTARVELLSEAREFEKTIKPFCTANSKRECRIRDCRKIHFIPIIKPHTETGLGDCSYLNTCHKMDVCKYLHYALDVPVEQCTKVTTTKDSHPAIWYQEPFGIQAPVYRVYFCPDYQVTSSMHTVRKLDFSILGKFSIVIADPAWDIHMSLPYGTVTDDEMTALPVSCLQDEGVLMLWVTNRCMELARECMSTWGYRRVDELVWVKINQLQRLIRTGRTGHWLNHSKEHLLIGLKGNPTWLEPFVDVDVVVSEVRETSRKPDEIYDIAERLAGKYSRKLGRNIQHFYFLTFLEIFGREHNMRVGWITLGNQLPGTVLHESDLKRRYLERYPEAASSIINT